MIFKKSKKNLKNPKKFATYKGNSQKLILNFSKFLYFFFLVSL